MPATHYLDPQGRQACQTPNPKSTTGNLAEATCKNCLALAGAPMATPPVPTSPTPVYDPFGTAKVLGIRVAQAVMLPGRGALISLTSTPHLNPGLTGDSGNLAFSAHAYGIVILDPKSKTRVLVPWGNILSATIE